MDKSKSNSKYLFRIMIAVFLFINLQPISRLYGQQALTKQQWLEDLEFIEQTIIKKHRYPFHKVTAGGFSKAVQRLRKQIPQLKDYEIIVEMARIVAIIGDGHSRLSLPIAESETVQSHNPSSNSMSPIHPFHQLPVKFEYFSDGLFITAAREKYKHLLGKKVTAFDNTRARKVLQILKSVIHKDNTMWDLVWAPYLATIPKVLAALKVIGSPHQVSLKLQTTPQDSTTVVMKLPDPQDKTKWTTLEDTLSSKPLYLQQPDNSFWMRFLPEKGILYVQVNRINDKKEETLAQFSRRISHFTKKNSVNRLVLDIRHNTGGNNYLNRSLILAILRSPNINKYGKLFTIIGRKTFSAAMNLASQLEQWTNTLFIGEPTGSSPSHYGDSRKFSLPNSGLTLRLSSIYWRGWTVKENRLWIAPAFSTDPSSIDFLEGKDPAMEIIKNYSQIPTLYGQLLQLLIHRKTDQAFLRYFKFKNDPETAHLSTEHTLNQLGAYLIQRKQYLLARRLLQQNLRDYPQSFAGWMLLARIYLSAKQNDKAIKTLKKALEIKPNDSEARKMLKKAQT